MSKVKCIRRHRMKFKNRRLCVTRLSNGEVRVHTKFLVRRHDGKLCIDNCYIAFMPDTAKALSEILCYEIKQWEYEQKLQELQEREGGLTP